MMMIRMIPQGPDYCKKQKQVKVWVALESLRCYVFFVNAIVFQEIPSLLKSMARIFEDWGPWDYST